MEHHLIGNRPPTGQSKQQQVEEDNDEKIYSDEDLPTNVTGEKPYKVTKTMNLRPQDEIGWDKELDWKAKIMGRASGTILHGAA